MEHKTDMNITKYEKTEQQFYRGIRNRHDHY